MSQRPLTDDEKKQREERFRYTDLSHPLMQVLFQMQLPARKQPERYDS